MQLQWCKSKFYFFVIFFYFDQLSAVDTEFNFILTVTQAEYCIWIEDSFVSHRHYDWRRYSRSVEYFWKVLHFQKCDCLHFCFQSQWKEFERTVSSLVSCGGKTNSSIQLWKLSEHSDCIRQSIHQQRCTHPYHDKVRTYPCVTLEFQSYILSNKVSLHFLFYNKKTTHTGKQNRMHIWKPFS